QGSIDDPFGRRGLGDVTLDGEHLRVLRYLDPAGAGDHRPAPRAVAGHQAGADTLRPPGDDGDPLSVALHDLSLPGRAYPAGSSRPAGGRSRTCCRVMVSRMPSSKLAMSAAGMAVSCRCHALPCRTSTWVTWPLPGSRRSARRCPMSPSVACTRS